MSTQNTYNQEIQLLWMDYHPGQPENIPGLCINEAPSSKSANPGVIASNSPLLNLNPGL